MIFFHPITVHFPVAFFILASLFYSVFLVTRKTEYDRFSWIIFYLGYAGAVAAITTGLVDAGGFSGRPVSHSNAAFSFFAIYSLLLLARWKGKSRLYFPLIIFGLGFLLLAGFLGGQLVEKMIFS